MQIGKDSLWAGWTTARRRKDVDMDHVGYQSGNRVRDLGYGWEGHGLWQRESQSLEWVSGGIVERRLKVLQAKNEQQLMSKMNGAGRDE